VTPSSEEARTVGFAAMRYSPSQLRSRQARRPVTDALIRTLVVFYLPVAVWEVVSPRTVWQVFEAWWFANPQAVRPSAAGYTARRVVAVAILVLLVLAATN
jgi:hypothetical protein